MLPPILDTHFKKSTALGIVSSTHNVTTEALREPHESNGPLTPKRAYIAPELLPLGLERADFHRLYVTMVEQGETTLADDSRVGTNIVRTENRELWNAEDDRILVELVLKKLRLSK